MTGSKPGERRGGRQKGTPYRVNAELKLAFQKHGDELVRALLALTKSDDERAAMREVGSGTTRVDADKLAFDELLWIWHAANPVETAPGKCAACGTAFEPPVMSLPDGAQVCDKPDHGCLIAYGNGRRMEAVNALGSLGIKPPTWWEL